MSGIPLEEYVEDEECPGRVKIKQDGKEEEQEEYSVEEILSKKKEGGIWKYLIKWYRWSHAHNTWEPAANLTHCQEKLDEFEKEWKRKNGSSSKKKSVKPTEAPRDPGTAKDYNNSQEAKELDMMWLGDSYSMFRRKWKSTEEPVCVVGSAVYNSALLHLVRVRVKSWERNAENTSKKTKEGNTVIVLSKMFGKIFPQILIAYYESRLMLLDELKSEENLLRDAARAGLMHNLMKAKVRTNYGKIFNDMMPSDPDQKDKSLKEEDNYECFPKKQVEDEDDVERKKKVEEYKNTRDKFGLPYYYGDEVEEVLGCEEEYHSDDSEDWVEAK